MKRLLVAASATALIAGCAGPDAQTAADAASGRESPSAREYPTGSNLPRKRDAKAAANIPMGEGVRVHSREDLERIQGAGHGVPPKGSGLSP